MLTAQDARTLVGLQATDADHDARLQQLIDAAYEQAAQYVGPLLQSPVVETVPARNGRLILSQLPVGSITSITGLDSVADLTVNPRTGLVSGLPIAIGLGSWGWGGWPAGSGAGAVTVTYVAGHATVPASVEEGVRSWVRHRFLQESFGTDTYGGDAVAGAVTDFDGLPNAVRNAWAPYLIDKGWGIA